MNANDVGNVDADKPDSVEPVAGTFTDLGEAEIIPPRWVIQDLLPTGLVFLGAPPKAGKSTLEMAMCMLVAGLPCKALPPHLSIVPETGCVMGFSYEASAGELRHMCRYGLLIDPPNDKRVLIADDPWLFRLDDPGGSAKLLYWLEERKPKLCFLDPLRDFHNLEEKDSGGMNRILRPIQRWAKAHDSCMLVVHHTKKKDEGDYNANDLRGTGAIFGIADGVLMLTKKQHGLVTINATFKRGEGWDRTIKIATYEHAAEGGSEKLGDLEEKVLKLLQGGASGAAAIGEQLKIGPNRAAQAIAALKRNKLI